MSHFDNGATSKIDDVLFEHGRLLYILPLADCLTYFGWGVVVVVAYSILVSAQGPLVFGFGVWGFWGFGAKGLGPGLDN